MGIVCTQILDLLDCTGSGDVATSQVVKADDEGCILGVHGNKLKPNPGWTNPTGAPSPGPQVPLLPAPLPPMWAAEWQAGGTAQQSLRSHSRRV